jgi:threonine 3-dehydrogenase
MRAIAKERPEPGLELVERPVPEIRADEVLIEVRRAGICGTDLHIRDWDEWAQSRVHPPVVLGHEFAGVVAEVGELVQGVSVGDLISAEGHITCGVCEHCRTGESHVCRDTRIVGIDRDGAFAEYVAVPATNVVPVPRGVPLDHAAVFDPLGNAFHTVLDADIPGRAVAIIGCGPIGLFAVGIARAAGAARVIAVEVLDHRLEMAREMGADLLLNPERDDVPAAVLQATEGYGADVVCEMSGHPDGVRQAMRICRNAGRVQLLGLPRGAVPVDLADDVIFKGLTVYGVIGRRMYRTWIQMRDFLASGILDISPVITHRVTLDDFERGFAAIESGEAGKVILRLDGGD